MIFAGKLVCWILLQAQRASALFSKRGNSSCPSPSSRSRSSAASRSPPRLPRPASSCPCLPFPARRRPTLPASTTTTSSAAPLSIPTSTRTGSSGTPDGNYTGFDFPGGSSFTNAINDAGDITGISEVETQDCPIAGCEYIRHANGTRSAITKGGNPLDGMGEQILKNKFIGSYYYTDEEGSIQQHGFWAAMRSGKDISLPFDNVGRARAAA